MKLYAKKAEFRALKTLTDPEIKSSKRLEFLGKLDKNLFHLEPVRKAYLRVAKVASTQAEIMDWEDLLSDPVLDESFRELLEEVDVGAAFNKKTRKACINNLEKYRKKRSVYELSKLSLESLAKDSVDIDELLDTLGNKIAQARRDMTEEETIINIGRGHNVDKVVDEMLDGKGEAILKTGFKDYDDVNGGLPAVGLMILASTTSGGKSVLSMNLIKNMLEQNDDCDVLRVSLEMTDVQELKRLSSNLTGIPFWKIKQNKLSDREKTAVRKAIKKYQKKLMSGGDNTKGNRYSFVSPKRSMTIEDVLNMARPFGHKVLCIDYISLLEGVDDDNQWRMLSAIARVCKVYAHNTGTLIILLAQLDAESDGLRYSKGMKEHCDILWQWNYANEEVRETHVLPVKTGKARDGELVHFDLDERYDIMSVFNRGEGENVKVESGGSSSEIQLTVEDLDERKKKKKKKKRPKDSDDSDDSDKPKKKKKKKKKVDKDGEYDLS